MTNGDLKLHLQDYSFFPYERVLAEREVAALVGRKFEAGERFFRVSPKWNGENLWRLTYFARSENDTGIHETLQHQLEHSHRTTVGRNHRRQSTRYSVHGLHEYKGKFNPQLAHALLNIFGAGEKHRILDPFCGSGTTLIEAAHLGISGTGFDMNPLAVFIANAKLAALSSDTASLRTGLQRVTRTLSQKAKPSLSSTPRLEYLAKWFTPEILITLERLRLAISAEVKSLEEFYLTIASNLLREYSLQDPADLRIRRRQTPLPTKPLVESWAEAVREQIAIIENVQPLFRGNGASSRARLADSREWSAMRAESGLFDFVITSPPYATALPYIDTQRLSLVWLGLIKPEDIRKLEGEVLGSREVLRGRQELEDAPRNNVNELPDAAVRFCMNLSRAIGPSDGFRRQAVPLLLYRYLTGMKATFGNLYRLLRKGGRMAWVVGVNQTTLGGAPIVIDTPALLASVAEQAGFQIEEPIKLQAYQRYGVHQKNSIKEETVLMFRR